MTMQMTLAALFTRVPPWKRNAAAALVAFLVAFSVVVGAGLRPNMSAAQGAGATPFGGLSTFTWYCTCTGGIAHTITDYTQPSGVSGNLLWSPGTMTYMFGQVYNPGVYLLGLWNSGGECEYYCGYSCCPYTVVGTMQMVGTSM